MSDITGSGAGAVRGQAVTWCDASDSLARRIDAKGNDIPDAYVAAFAVENNATFLSANRRFARLPDLRWLHPLDAQ